MNGLKELLTMYEGTRMDTTTLLEEHQQLIRRYAQVALMKLKKPTICNLDDLCQEGVLAFYDALKEYDSSRGATFKTWLITCLRQHFIDLVTKSYRKKETANSVHIENIAKHHQHYQNTFDVIQIRFLFKKFTEDELQYINALLSLVDKNRRFRRKLARQAIDISYEREIKLRNSIRVKIKK